MVKDPTIEELHSLQKKKSGRRLLSRGRRRLSSLSLLRRKGRSSSCIHKKNSGLECSTIFNKLAVATCSLIDLPDDLLRLIISRVAVYYYSNLVAVCKTLRLLTGPVIPVHSYSSSLPFFLYCGWVGCIIFSVCGLGRFMRCISHSYQMPRYFTLKTVGCLLLELPLALPQLGWL